MKKEITLETLIENLPISQRTKNVLRTEAYHNSTQQDSINIFSKHYKIKDIIHLTCLTDKQLLRLRNIGKKSLEEILSVFEECNFNNINTVENKKYDKINYELAYNKLVIEHIELQNKYNEILQKQIK